jgi:hypothetical protein
MVNFSKGYFPSVFGQEQPARGARARPAFDGAARSLHALSLPDSAFGHMCDATVVTSGGASMSPTAFTTASRQRPALLLLAGIGGAAAAGTLVLWAYYGTAVFFEIVRAGWAACF